MAGIDLSEEAREQIRETAGRNFRDFIFGASPGSTLDGTPVPQWLAGPEPVNPLSKFQWNSGREVCRRWADGKSPSVLPGREAFYRNLCTPYIEDEYGPIPDGSLEVPFSGGQCAGVPYFIRGTFSWTGGVFCSDGGQVNDGDTRQISDIFGLLSTVQGPVTSATIEGFGPDCRGGPTRIRFEVISQSAVQVGFFDIGGIRTYEGVSGSFQFVRATGSGDCGDPDPVYDPGGGVPGIPGPAPIPQPPGTPWPFPGFRVDVNPDGTINVDFGDGGPDETVDPVAPPGGSPPPPPGDQGDPGAGGATGEGGEEAGEAPPGKVLVGLRLQHVGTPPARSEVAPGVYRGGAYIYMGGDVGLDQDYAGSLLRTDQFVFSEKDNLTRWRVSANVGFNWNVTPYYREAEE